jgi:hypothetical protein
MTDQPVITVDGHAIPLLGFGTWNLTPEDARRMVAEALRIGYRHLDTAWIYHNEAAVGDGIRDAIEAGHVAREDIWLTTKIWVAHFERDALLKQAKESAASLGFTPDLLLLHWPKAEPDVRRDPQRAERGEGSGPHPDHRPVQLPIGRVPSGADAVEGPAGHQPGRIPPLSQALEAEGGGEGARLLDHRMVPAGPGQDRRRRHPDRDRQGPWQVAGAGHAALADPAEHHRHSTHHQGQPGRRELRHLRLRTVGRGDGPHPRPRPSRRPSGRLARQVVQLGRRMGLKRRG